MLGATATYHSMAQDYLFWWSLFIIPNFLSMNLQGFCRNDGQPVLVATIGSAIIIALFCIFDVPLAKIFGARGLILEEICKYILPFSWGFIFAGANSMVSSYLYSTMHSRPAIVLNLVRSFATNTFCILVLPMIFGKGIIWYTYGISEVLVSLLAIALVFSVRKHRNIGREAM